MSESLCRRHSAADDEECHIQHTDRMRKNQQYDHRIGGKRDRMSVKRTGTWLQIFMSTILLLLMTVNYAHSAGTPCDQTPCSNGGTCSLSNLAGSASTFTGSTTYFDVRSIMYGMKFALNADSKAYPGMQVSITAVNFWTSTNVDSSSSCRIALYSVTTNALLCQSYTVPAVAASSLSLNMNSCTFTYEPSIWIALFNNAPSNFYVRADNAQTVYQFKTAGSFSLNPPASVTPYVSTMDTGGAIMYTVNYQLLAATPSCACPVGFSGAQCATNLNDCSMNPCRNSGSCGPSPLAGFLGTVTAVSPTYMGINTNAIWAFRSVHTINSVVPTTITLYAVTFRPGGIRANFSIGIYSDIAGSPGALLCTTGATANTVTMAPFTVSFTAPCVLTVPNAYWTGLIHDHTSSYSMTVDGTGSTQLYTLTRSFSAGFPATLTGGYGPAVNSFGTLFQYNYTLYAPAAICTCAAGFTGVNCTDVINICASSPCKNGGTCVNDTKEGLVGTFTPFAETGSGLGPHQIVSRFLVGASLSTPTLAHLTVMGISVWSTQSGLPVSIQMGVVSAAGSAGQTAANLLCNTSIVTVQGGGKFRFPLYGVNGGACILPVPVDYYFVLLSNATGNLNLAQANTANDPTWRTYSALRSQSWNGGLARIISQTATFGVNPVLFQANYTLLAPSAMCNCRAGYNGANCTAVIDNCWSSPCANSGTCTNAVNTYFCTCAAGYQGVNCTGVINVCAAATPCKNGGTCVNGINSYVCRCASGYSGVNCTQSICSPSPCDNGGTCLFAPMIDSEGTFTPLYSQTMTLTTHISEWRYLLGSTLSSAVTTVNVTHMAVQILSQDAPKRFQMGIYGVSKSEEENTDIDR